VTTLPLVSVIIPSYNHERFVEQSILSVFQQTYPNIEVLVIDDGSSDRSVEIIEKLKAVYNFQFIKRENRGTSKTLNEAFNLVNGEYVCFLASDDYYSADKIQMQVEYYEKNQGFGFIHSGCIVVDQAGNELHRSMTKGRTEFSGDVFDLLLEGCFVSAATVMIKRSVVDDIGMFDENIKTEDWDYWLRIARKYKVGFQEQLFVYYRQHGNNTYFSSDARKILSMYESEKAILSKWRHEACYPRVIKLYHLRWFYKIGGVDRLAALPHFFGAMTKANSAFFWKALVKFFLGDSMFGRLRSRFVG